MYHSTVCQDTVMFLSASFSSSHISTFHGTASQEAPQASRMKLLNPRRVTYSLTHRAVSANVRPFKFDVHYFDGGGSVTTGAL